MNLNYRCGEGTEPYNQQPWQKKVIALVEQSNRWWKAGAKPRYPVPL